MLFRGRRYQRGNGFGSVFAGLLKRGVAPLVRKGLKYLGSKAVETGIKVGTDMHQGRSFKDSVRDRFQETLGVVRQDGAHKYQKLINDDSDDETNPPRPKKRKLRINRKKKDDKHKLIKGEGMRAKRRSVIKKKKMLKKKAKNRVASIKKVSKKKKRSPKRKSHSHLMERDLF